MHNIDWCEGGLKLADISTKNVGDNGLNPRIKFIMVRIDNWYRTLLQEGWQDTGYSVGKIVLYDYTRFSWLFDSIILKGLYRVWYMIKTLKTVLLYKETVLRENHLSR